MQRVLVDEKLGGASDLSQKKIYDILKSLGGQASLQDISAKARQLYPDATLWQYAGHTLRKMRKWGIVRFDPANKKWIITGEYEK